MGVNYCLLPKREQVGYAGDGTKEEPSGGSQEQVFVREKRELLLTEEGFVAGRILNGDEQNYLAFGSRPSVQRVSFYRREELTAK